MRNNRLRIRACWWIFLLPLGIALAEGCGRTLEGTCNGQLDIGIMPPDTTLSVAQSFIPHISILACGGVRPIQDVILYTARDTTVASVDSATTRITARGVGQTLVDISGAVLGPVGSIRVTVSGN